VKTLEQIKLDKIQEESAAYYSYAETDVVMPNAATVKPQPQRDEDLTFKVLSLEEIRKNKRKPEEGTDSLQPDSTTSRRVETRGATEHRSKPIRLKRCLDDVSRVKLKRQKLTEIPAVSSTNDEPVMGMDIEDQLPSSNTDDDISVKTSEDDLLKDIDALLGD
jgi:hypothetical protein